MRLYVNIYEVGRAFGGPEEGGWWFDTGNPIGSIPVDLTEAMWDEARETFCRARGISRSDDDVSHEDIWGEFLAWWLRREAERVRDEYLDKYPHSGARSSVLGGDDYDVVIEEVVGKAYPEYTPHYE